MAHHTLQDKLRAAGSAVTLLRNSQIGPSVMYGVPSEFSNWRDEQLAWRESAALFDLTHHMYDLSVEGPDAVRLFSDLGVNSFKGFAPGKAKQFVCCNSDGYIVGDAILFFLEENRLSLLGQPIAHNWVQYHARIGGYDVKLERDEPTVINPNGKRKLYRFQVQGPNALKVLREASGGTLQEISFFHLGEFTIAGRKVRALRHGMAGVPGLELFGRWEDMEQIRAAILEAGSQFGLRPVGAKAFLATTLESGWIPVPLPAIYSDERLEAYRTWLPATSPEAICSLGGSFCSDDIRDYYVTPHDLGYWPMVKFDHDFIGRAALEAMRDTPRRQKVTLAWNPDDVTAVMRTLFERGDPVKYIDLPISGYATWHYDKVLLNGRNVGISRYAGYTCNERALLSLAMVDVDVPIGSEVSLTWGEDERGSRRPVVERHRQIEIRAVVSPCPYSEVTRSVYKA